MRRPDHDDARRVRLADDRQFLREQDIPRFTVELVMRLVEQLEGNVARRLREPRRDLLPESGQSCPAKVEILRAGVEVMLVDDHAETRPLGVADYVIELGEPSGVEPVLRVHVPERLQVEAHEIEAAAADLGEVPPLEAALALVGPIGVVAEDVDAPMEGGLEWLLGGCRFRQGRRRGKGQGNTDDLLPHARYTPGRWQCVTGSANRMDARDKSREVVVLLNRRELIGTSALLASSAALEAKARQRFVRTAGGSFRLGEQPYRIAGTNMWYAAYLGANAPFGNRDRLRRELDRLTALGINNVRILGCVRVFAAQELGHVRRSATAAGNYNEALLRGPRLTRSPKWASAGIKAVIYLTNFWEWSGGMMTYLYWTNGGRYINMNDPAHPWPEFPDMSSEFYGSPPPCAMFNDYVRAVVGTDQQRHRPAAIATIRRSWRGSSPTSRGRAAATEAGPAAHARLSRVDRRHRAADQVARPATIWSRPAARARRAASTSDQCVVDAHRSPAIDYVTAHIWPQNWSWADPKDLPAPGRPSRRNTRDYIAQQVAIARRLGKPLVIEEFGFPARRRQLRSGQPTTFKDRFYAADLWRRARQRALGRAGRRAAISGRGAAKAARSTPTIISAAATPATSATRRTSRRAGTACSTATLRPRR